MKLVQKFVSEISETIFIHWLVSEISETLLFTFWFQKFLKPFIHRLVSEISETISETMFQNWFQKFRLMCGVKRTSDVRDHNLRY